MGFGRRAFPRNPTQESSKAALAGAGREGTPVLTVVTSEEPRPAGRVAAGLPATARQRRSAGAGSKGPRFYDWAWLADVNTDTDPDDGGEHTLLIRRNNTTRELAFYRCWTPQSATLAALVRIAGIRWTV